jgi:hypothetical protein
MADTRQSEPQIVETTTEARGGSTPGMTRYVLVFGVLLVVIAFTIIVLVGLR